MLCLRVRRGWFDRTATVVASVLLVMAPVLADTAERPAFAEIGGTVVGADGLTAVAGATVKAAHIESQKVYTSAATSPNGSYILSGLPEGWYDVAVETPKGQFVSSSLIRTSAGHRAVASIALGATAPTAEDTPPADPNAPAPEPPKEEPPQGDPPADPNAPAPPPEQQSKKKGGGFFKSPGGAALLIVFGSLGLAAAASSATDNDIDIDPMTPGGS